MAQSVLKENGCVIPCHSLHRLSSLELAPSDEVEVVKILSFNSQITSILGDSVALPIGPLQDQDANPYDLEPYGELHNDILGSRG
jgi:hypothetical protein